MLKNNLFSVFMLIISLTSVSPAFSSGNSIDDGFAALEKSRNPSTASGQGVNSGFGVLDEQRSKKASAATGHGVDAGIQELEADRAEQKAMAARIKRAQMEEEAKQKDQEMQGSCYCVYNNCQVIQLVISCTNGPGGEACERKKAADEKWAKEHAAEIAEDERRERKAKRDICDAWKAAGPKANSESFKAQLRQQDAAIAASQERAAEAARQRDSMIEADIKQEQIATEAKLRAYKDKEASLMAAQDAKYKAALAKEESKQRQWCMADAARLSDCSCSKYNPNKKGSACSKSLPSERQGY